jgi:hypothetical protein
MSKNWTGNNKAPFTCNGASNHSKLDREENDYYATHPKHVEELLKVETFNHVIFEPAVGEGHIAKVLIEKGHKVIATDIVDRGYPNTKIKDFLTSKFKTNVNIDIITNPPYKYAKEFVEKSLNIVKKNNKVAMFLKLTFLESSKRKKLFKKYPPKYIYVYSKRAICAKNGNFDKYPSSAIAYCWFVWVKGYENEPKIRWL